MPARPPAEFLTARLRLRPPRLEDAPVIFARWTQDPEVTRYLLFTPHGEFSESEAHIVRSISAWQAGTSFVWLIEQRETGELIGSIAARPEQHGVVIGYLLARDAWGHGYMAEAVTAVSDWYLAQPGVQRVWAAVDVENTRSARVLQKAGFQFEGVLRRWEVMPNLGRSPRDAHCYSRIAEG